MDSWNKHILETKKDATRNFNFDELHLEFDKLEENQKRPIESMQYQDIRFWGQCLT